MTQEQAFYSNTDAAGALSCEWYRAVFDYSLNAILLTDATTGAVLAANPAACRVLGYTEEQLCALDRTAVFDYEDPVLPAAAGADARTGQFHGELAVRRADGTAFPVELTQSLFPGPDGTTVVASFFIDISERKAAEAALRESESRYRLLFDNMDEGFALHEIITDETGTAVDFRFLAANEAYDRHTGLSGRAIIGKTMLEVLPGADRRRIEAYGRVALNGERLAFDYHSSTFGRYVHVRAYSPARGLFATIFEDITEQKRMETAIRASEQQYRMLADNIPDVIFTLEAGGRLTYVSPSVERMRGCSVEEVLAETPESQIAAESLADVRRHLAESIAEAAAGRPLQRPYHEAKHRRKDGSCFWAETYLRARYDPDGKFGGFVGVIRDISERKRLEEALRRREERLRMVIENSPDVLWIWDQDGNLQAVSQTLQSAYGLPPEAMLEAAAQTHALAAAIPADVLTAERLVELGAPDMTCADLWLRMQRAVKSCVANLGEKVCWETHVVTPGGKVRDLHTTYQGFRRSTEDAEVVAVTHDVTEIVQAKEQVQRALRQLSLAADAAEIGIWKWRFEDDHLEWDDRMYEFYAIPTGKRDLVLDDGRARVHPDDRARNDAEMVEARCRGQDWQTTYRILLPDGRIRHIYSAAVVERDQGGEPIGMIGINRDITDQKTYEQYLQNANAVLEQRVAERTDDLRQTIEELRRANAGKDAFLAAVSHELRTPLTGILGVAETLGAEIRGPLNEYQKRYVAAIQLSGDRLLTIVNSVLNYTHAMAQPTPPLALCRIGELCAAAVKHARLKAKAKQQIIEMNVDPFDLQLLSDGDSIMQILEALLDNAVKFTPHKGCLGVDIGIVDNGAAIQMAVRDTGIGIKEEQRPYLFQPLTQVDQRLARDYEGIGLGLALVKRKVEILGGTVVVQSSVDKGSTFIVTLPTNFRP